jgi:hypothetical protein
MWRSPKRLIWRRLQANLGQHMKEGSATFHLSPDNKELLATNANDVFPSRTASGNEDTLPHVRTCGALVLINSCREHSFACGPMSEHFDTISALRFHPPTAALINNARLFAFRP